jgi:hypothetical protein
MLDPFRQKGESAQGVLREQSPFVHKKGRTKPSPPVFNSAMEPLSGPLSNSAKSLDLK